MGSSKTIPNAIEPCLSVNKVTAGLVAAQQLGPVRGFRVL
jgi:hypothetical protein